MTDCLDVYMAELSPAMKSLKDISPAQFINACNMARMDVYDALENSVMEAQENCMLGPTAGRVNMVDIDNILDRHGFALRIKELRWDYRYKEFKYPKGDLV